MSTLTTRKSTIKIEVSISDEDLSDTLITACEGGIGYWFRGLEYRHSDPEGAWMSGYVSDEAAEACDEDNLWGFGALDDAVEAKIDNEDVLATTTLLDLDVVLNGVEAILTGRVGVRSDLLAQVMTLTTDSPDVDADAADCIVQAGLFGELVYG